MSQELIVEKKDCIARVTLNRPEVLNALSASLRREIVAAFKELTLDTQVQVIILTGAGRSFCAGLDLRKWVARSRPKADSPAGIFQTYWPPLLNR